MNLKELEKMADDVKAELSDDAPPKPALVNGEPLLYRRLPDGRPIYVAAGREGEPLRDSNGDYVVIDPQTGFLRHKLPRTAAQGLPPMKDIDQTNLAIQQLQQREPGFLAFARAQTPVKEFKKTLQQKVWLAFNWPLALVAWFSAKASAAIIAVRRVAMKLANRLRPVPAMLQIKPLQGVEKYLNARALQLIQNPIKSTIYQTPDSKLAYAQYANMRVPLEPDGSVNEEYIHRWAMFLNSMADRGIWKHGVLSGPSTITLAMTDLRWEVGLFTFLFSNESDYKRLNEQVGFPVFGQEGDFAFSSDWSLFPW
jgi:hypothetical protein